MTTQTLALCIESEYSGRKLEPGFRSPAIRDAAVALAQGRSFTPQLQMVLPASDRIAPPYGELRITYSPRRIRDQMQVPRSQGGNSLKPGSSLPCIAQI